MGKTGSVSLKDIETEAETVAASTLSDVKETVTEAVKDGVSAAEADPVGTAEAVVKAVQDAPATVADAEGAADEAVKGAADAATQALDDPTSKINETVDNVARAAIDAAVEAGAELLKEHAPPVVDDIIDAAEPEVETRIFAVTGLVTKDFEHIAQKYIVEVETAVVKGLHETALKAVLAAKILEEEGHNLIESALNVLEVTGAKALFHRG